MNKKKLLFICGNISPKSSQGVRYSSMLPFFAEKYDLFLLSYNAFYDDKNIQIQTIVEKGNQGTISKEHFSTTKSYLLRLYKRFIRPFVFPDKYKFAIESYKKQVKRIVENNDISTVIIAMTPFSLYALAKYIKSLNNQIKVIVDLSDPFSFNGRRDYAFIYTSNFLLKYEEKLLNSVDAVVVLNPVIKSKYQQLFNFNNIYVIEQGAASKSGEVHNKVFKSKQDLTLLYAGGLYKGFREAFELYKAMNRFGDSLKLYLYGNINKELIDMGVGNIFYFGSINPVDLEKEYEKSDILVFIDNNTGYQVPGKLFELLAMQKPVLFIYSNEKSPTLEYIKDAEYVFKTRNSSEEIIKSITKIQNTDFTTITPLDLSKFSWDNLLKKYYKIIDA